MDIWRKLQIANVVMAVVAVVLSVAALYATNVVYWAMWAWSLALWMFLFLGPMPVIERNKREHPVAMALSFLVAVLVAVSINTWLQVQWPETHGFSRGVLVYSVAYVVLALVLAGWLKLKKNR